MVRRRLSPWILCVPALFAVAAVTVYPLARTFYFSLTGARLGNLDHPGFLGFQNYAYLLKDPDWWRAAANTAIFTVSSVAIELLLGLGVAMILNSGFKGRGAVRAAVLVPWAIPAVVSARIWSWMFNDIYGVINGLIRGLRLGSGEIAWLAEDRLALLTLVIVDVWKTTPFMALLLLAGLQSIPKSVNEAAQVDGASAWKRFRYVTLPLLKTSIMVSVLFRALDALRIFDLPFVLTSNTKATSVLSIFARQQMVDFQEVGYASAASFLIFCLTGSLALAYLGMGRTQLGLDRA